MSYPLVLATPERTLFSGDVESLTVRTTGGELAFLTGHVPFIGAVVPSECKVELPEGSSLRLAVHGGFVEMGPAGAALLTPAAELPDEIDVARAEAAQARLASASVEDEAVQLALKRAEVRIAVAGGRQH
ncbi:MAG: F0F1 ATP synthase subunit epsilon [Actinomycetota bacterium]|nr:F0F1 ATP synthase subunit epsilon [Actinomycetota bacterium]